MPPARPKLVDASELEFKSFDQYVEEANRAKPFLLPLSADEVLTVECPTGNELIAFAEAQNRQDVVAMTNVIFKADAARMLEITGSQRFTVLPRIVNDVLTHYGFGGAALPES